MAILRNFAQGPFEPGEVAALERLMPHFQRAAWLDSQIGGSRRQNQALEAALDRLTFGVLITDRAGRVLLLNRAATLFISKELSRARARGSTTIA